MAGNLIGTNQDGTAPLANIVGIYINGAAGNQIGAPGSPNTISGNSSVGVEIYGVGSTGNVVEGNIIGLASDGQTAFTNNGQFVQPTGVFILNASGNVIGGTSGARNVISGNESAAVYIVSRSGVASGNIVQGNLIGLAIGGGARPGQQRLRRLASQLAEQSSPAHRAGRESVRPQPNREFPEALGGRGDKSWNSCCRVDQWLTCQSDSSPRAGDVIGSEEMCDPRTQDRQGSRRGIPSRAHTMVPRATSI